MDLRNVRSALRPLLASALGITMAAFSPGALDAQAVGQIAGTITDVETNEPVAVVQISVLGTTIGALSGPDGRYTIAGVPAGQQTLVVQRIGFVESRHTVNVSAGQTTLLNLTVRMQPLQMEEIVVTGLIDPVDGARSPITVARVSRETMPVPVLGSPIQNLQGQVSGVTVARGSGEPGSSAAIRLRSSTLLPAAGLNTNPLIVVDGVILGEGSIDVEAMDIESIEIVKGAAAASLYGSRAANGVIQIRTNRGTNIEEGSTQFTIRSEYGFQTAFEGLGLPTHHAYQMNADQTMYADSLGNPTLDRSLRIRENNSIAARQFMDNPYPTPLYDNLNNAFQGGRVQQHTLTFAQNTASTNYAISLNRNVESGTIPGSDGYERNSFRVNLDHRFRQNVALSVSGYHARSSLDEADVTFATLYSALPDVDITQKDAAGLYLQTPDPNDDYENPLWEQAIREHTQNVARTLASANLTWDPFNWMNVRAGASYDRRDTKELNYWPIGYPTISNDDPDGDGDIEYETDISDAWNAEAQVSLHRDFGALNTRITARGIFERERNESVDADASVLQIQGVKSLEAALASDQRSTSSETETRTNGYLVDTALDYEGRYILTALGRRDDSSVFGPDEREHYYYRVGGAWRIGEESWFDLPGITEFKISAARGTAGGRPGFAAQYEVWSLNNGVATKQQLGNRNLKPSLTTENEVSLEVVIANRFGIELTHAWQRSEDQLYQVPLLAFTGYQSQWQNGGTIEGRTTELSIQAQIIQGRRFGWTSTFVADHSTSRIAEWPFPCTNPAWLYRCEGRGLYEIWGVRFIDSYDRLAIHDNGAVAANADEFAINDDGLMVWVGPGNSYTDGPGPDGIAGTSDDLWGTSATVGGRVYNWGMPIVERDATGSDQYRQKIGDGTHYNLGWINSFTWGPLSLHAQLNAKIGGDAVNTQHQGMINNRESAPMMDQYGKPEGLKKPIGYWQAVYAGGGASTYFVEDGSYLKLRVLSASYRFTPNQIARFGLARVGVTSMQIGLIARDLFTITDFRGFDPEQGLAVTGAAQTAGAAYPPSRTFTAEIQVTF